jgi:hypothetical protein
VPAADHACTVTLCTHLGLATRDRPHRTLYHLTRENPERSIT